MRAVAPLTVLFVVACSTAKEPSEGDGSSGTTIDTGTSTTDDSGDTADSGDTDDTGEPAPVYPDLVGATCGSDSYTYLPTNDMGRLVEHEQDKVFSLSAAAIGALVDSQGLGDVIDARYDVELHKVRYVTQDRGEEVETTGYVAFPVLDAPESVPTMLWLHPTLGFGDECAPSSGSLEGAAFPVLAATQGYVVAAPDYIGMNGWGAPSDRMHSWIVGEPTAIASLDSLRASAALATELGVAASPDLSRVIALGASQGGHAALLADHYSQAYAPEVRFVGVVAAIPVSDLGAVAVYGMLNDVDATAGLAGGLVTGWDWYGRQADLTEVLRPEIAETLPDALMDACADNFDSILPGVDSADDIYTTEALERAADGSFADWQPWSCYFGESSLRTNTAVQTGFSTVPKLIVTGSEDTLAYSPPVRADAVALCEESVPIELIECQGLGHVSAAVETLPLYLPWAKERLDGVPLTECDIQEPSVCN
jgi:hypothetical protein